MGRTGKEASYLMTAVLSVKYKARSPTLHMMRKGFKRSEKVSDN